MIQDQRISELMNRTVDETPGEIPADILALLPGIFHDLLDLTEDELPVELQFCDCDLCIIGVAGDWLYDLTGDEQWGFS